MKNKDFICSKDLRSKHEDGDIMKCGYDKREQSGRSMVEMLGVLAIVGVLSIGGMASYNHALSKSKANNILNGVSKRILIVSQRLIMGQTAFLAEYSGEKIGNYGVELKTEGYSSDQFGIQVSGIEQSVCERLQEQELSSAIKVELNGVNFADATCAEENNALTYVFSADLDPNKVSSDSGENSGSDSGEKLWEPKNCNYDGDCLDKCEQCDNGVCLKFQIGEFCSCGNDEMVSEEWWDTLVCYPCNYADNIYVEYMPDGECGKCPNRTIITDEDGYELCVLKECTNGYLDEYNYCNSCDTPYGLDEEACDVCPNREIDEEYGYCVLKECPDGYFKDKYNDCYSCDDIEMLYIEENDCAKCPNREMNENYGACALKECLNGYFKNEEGKCFSCDAIGETSFTNEDECDKCPNREWSLVVFSDGHTAGYCGLKQCPDGMVRSKHGECFLCGREDVFYGVEPTECAKCPGYAPEGDNRCAKIS